MAEREIEQLLVSIDQAFDRRSWHGTNLRGSLRGVTAREAAWRPAPGRHNVWELAVHAAYWKYTVRRRMLGEPKGSFPLPGSDFFPRPDPPGAEPDERAWKADVALLVATHKSLRAAISELRARGLSTVPRGSRVSNLGMIVGVAAHDLYHAGQIQLLKRLRESAGG